MDGIGYLGVVEVGQRFPPLELMQDLAGCGLLEVLASLSALAGHL